MIMLDHSELVFSMLKEFYLQIKPKKKCLIFDTSVLFPAPLWYLWRGISAKPEKVEKVDGLTEPQKCERRCIPFLTLAFYY